MKANFQILYDNKGKETGGRLSISNSKSKFSEQQKRDLEGKLIAYATEVLYRDKSFEIFSCVEIDVVSICIIINPQDLPSEEISIA